MLSRKRLIIFLVSFLSKNSPVYITKKGLEHTISDLIEEESLSKKQETELTETLRKNPQFLLNKNCPYFTKIKYYVLPFLKK
jgi:hypothetical protein